MSYSTMSLQQSVMMDVVSLMNDNKAMRRLRTVLDEMKGEASEADYITKEEVLDDLRDAFRELKLVKQGKRESRPIEELVNEL